MPLVMSDGSTLSDIPSEYLSNHDSLFDAIAAIDHELETTKAQYNKYSYTILMGTMGLAYQDDCLSESDLRGLFQHQVQFVKIYKELLGQSLRDKHLEFDDDEVDYINEPYALLSLFLEYLLFIVELHDPTYNILSKKRKRYDIINAAYWHYDGSPVQAIPLIAWRRRLMEDKVFFRDCAEIRKQLSKFKRWAYAHSSRLDTAGDWMVVFTGKRNENITMPANDHECWGILQEFCFRYKLEMVGTYLIPDSADYGLHFLPQRIHVNRSDFGLQVAIPDFYSYSLLKHYFESEFADLSCMFDRYPDERKVKAAMSVQNLRKVTALIRKALLAENAAQKTSAELRSYGRTIASYIKKLTMLRWGDSSRYTSIAEKIEPSSLSENRLIKMIDDAVKNHITDPQQKRLWAEFCRAMAIEGKFDPFR